MLRPSADGDGRFSLFFAHGAATKYNGNNAVFPAQTGQSAQESANSLGLSLTGPTPLVSQPAGVMQSFAVVGQQSLHVFRQPAGSIFPGPGVAAGPATVKYVMSQYKHATNAGNPSHVGMPIGYERTVLVP